MRVVVLSAALALVLAADAGAALPKRDCSTRGEGPAPITQLARPGDLRLGPVAFMGLHMVGDPADFKRFATRTRGRYLLKVPLMVRAGKVVTVSVAGQPGVGLTAAKGSSLRGIPRVRFLACQRDERAWSYDGTVGAITGFPSGFTLREPACVAIRVSVRGDRRYSAMVPFGTGGCGLQRFATAA
jgi:hypothetical protein